MGLTSCAYALIAVSVRVSGVVSVNSPASARIIGLSIQKEASPILEDDE